MDGTVLKVSAKDKLLTAALSVIRSRGYSATTVDDLCAEAGVTKGAFFHHFESKEALAVAAAHHWSEITSRLFANAPYHRHPDPLDRVLGYVDFRIALLKGQTPEFTCLVGTMVQEAFGTSPLIREACRQSIFGHAENVARDIEEAQRIHAPGSRLAARGLALHAQAVIQGAFILAKASEDPGVAVESLRHLRRYIELLIPKTKQAKRKEKAC